MDKSEFVAYHLILPQAKYQLAKIKLKENDSKSDTNSTVSAIKYLHLELCPCVVSIVVDDAFLQHKMV